MASEELSPDYLKKLNHPTDFAKEVGSLLPKLLIDIENNSLSSHFHCAVNTLLGPLIKDFEIENVEEKVLNLLLPCLGRIFSHTLASMVEALKNANGGIAVEDVKTTLVNLSQVCLHILSGYNRLLCCLLSYETIKCSWVMSLPRSLNDILAATFIHCRDSETVYASFFSTFSDFLTTFFRQGYEVQANFFKLLENVLIFNCSFEDELSLLTEVLETMARIGEIVVKFDPKAVIGQWKTYAKLSHKYATSLKPRLDIAQPIIFLSETLQQTVGMLNKQISTDRKTQNYNIKLGSSILKIIIKFCEDYEGYLGDCYSKILELLITLNGVVNLNGKNEITTELNQHIAVGAGPLLRHFIGEEQFIEEFSKRCHSLQMLTSDAKIGFLLLLLNVLKKLPNTEPFIKDLWWNLPLIENILKIFEACRYEIKNVVVDGCSAYTCLVSRTATCIISNDKISHFPPTEKLLISNLLQPDLLKAVFAQDLLCLLARLMSGDICEKQVLYLSGLIINWPEEAYIRPEFKYVGTTASRLFPLLSMKSRIRVCQMYPPEKSILWAFLDLEHLDPSCYEETQHFKSTINNLNCPINSLESYQQMVNTIQTLPNCIQLLRKKGGSNFSVLLTGLSKLWNLFNDSLCNFNHWSFTKLPNWWCGLFNWACKATIGVIPQMNNETLLKILQVMELAVRNSDTSCKMSVLKALKVMGECDFKGTCLQDLCIKISQLFTTLLLENDPIIKQMALESFSFFAHVTIHEEIIASAVKNNTNLQNVVASYLKSQPTALSPQTDVSEILCYSNDIFCHTCYIPVGYPSEADASISEIAMRPTKKLKIEFNEDKIEMAERILKDLIVFNNVISNPVESEDLRLICIKLSDQLELLKQKL